MLNGEEGRSAMSGALFSGPLPTRGARGATPSPAIYTSQSFAKARELLNYRPKRPNFARLLASNVDRILNSAKPADMALERITTVRLSRSVRLVRDAGAGRARHPPGPCIGSVKGAIGL